ncbi:helix-turn-helix domain-containing protein [Lactococcus formosensis subsp. bovis]|uniref:helix-turn-helix domain-containing protein n=1 Tax=Lactococcus TaxID=1357 RepID=UPI001BCF3EB9|nr:MULTISPECIES: helix-turn-helix transcriptional regulator [Lactococcus]
MAFYEILQELKDESGKSMNQIERELGFPRNTLSSFKKQNPSVNRLEAIAKYFNVSTDYLLGNTTAKDYDSKRLDESIENSKSFDGSPLDDEDKEIIHNLIKDYLESKGK